MSPVVPCQQRNKELEKKVGADRAPCQQRNKALEQQTGADRGTCAPPVPCQQRNKELEKRLEQTGYISPSVPCCSARRAEVCFSHKGTIAHSRVNKTSKELENKTGADRGT